jgi:hypothetical protein
VSSAPPLNGLAGDVEKTQIRARNTTSLFEGKSNSVHSRQIGGVQGGDYVVGNVGCDVVQIGRHVPIFQGTCSFLHHINNIYIHNI